MGNSLLSICDVQSMDNMIYNVHTYIQVNDSMHRMEKSNLINIQPIMKTIWKKSIPCPLQHKCNLNTKLTTLKFLTLQTRILKTFKLLNNVITINLYILYV